MQLTRLYLRNYRVFEDELELALPPGLVGIYGANGTGKSCLVESIRWTLFGKSRTDKGDVRTSGVNAECTTEVEFEHEGHLYLVRRTISGVNSTVRAEAHADRLQVAEGPRDTAAYIHSVLGMDDSAFRASVFAEQKQLTAFSLQAPNERRKLVLQLLGITPLDSARDLARRDARAVSDQYEHLRAVLPDVNALETAAGEAEQRAVDAEAAVAPAAAGLDTARAELESAQARFDALDAVGREHDALVAEGKGVRAEQERATERVEALKGELATLDQAAERRAALAPEVQGLAQAEARLALVESVIDAERRLEALPVEPEPPEPDEAAHDAARAEADAVRRALAELDGRLSGVVAEASRARNAVARAGELTPGAECPTCGQALGEAFEQVLAHRNAELREVEGRAAELQAERVARAAAVAAADRDLQQRAAALKVAQRARAAWEKVRDRRQEAETALSAAATKLDPPLADGEAVVLVEEVRRRKQAAEESHVLDGRLQRLDIARREFETERERAAEAAGRREALLEKVRSLGFSREQLDVARSARTTAATALEAASSRSHAAQLTATQARAEADAAATRLADGRDQHARIGALGEEVRHLGRTAELLSSFRNEVVGSVGPMLSLQAAELFGELTDHRYDALQVDPDTYEIRISDGGIAHGMDRFSGSEKDLANLALRVAISEHVRFQSGGAVGLLVLDEVFGSLDPDRKARMLAALERLRARFRQVLVVTHDADIKEELPNAIQVRETVPGRATAVLVGA
jgi:exonuclease SbcC